MRRVVEWARTRTGPERQELRGFRHPPRHQAMLSCCRRDRSAVCCRIASSNCSSSISQIASFVGPTARYERFAMSWPNRTSGAARSAAPGRARFLGVWARSWQEIPNARQWTNRTADSADDLDTDPGPRGEPGYPSRPGHAVVEHQQTVRPPINPGGRHPGLEGSKPGDLSLQFVRVGPRRPGWWKVQRSGIDFHKQLRHLLIFASMSRDGQSEFQSCK